MFLSNPLSYNMTFNAEARRNDGCEGCASGSLLTSAKTLANIEARSAHLFDWCFPGFGPLLYRKGICFFSFIKKNPCSLCLYKSFREHENQSKDRILNSLKMKSLPFDCPILLTLLQSTTCSLFFCCQLSCMCTTQRFPNLVRELRRYWFAW